MSDSHSIHDIVEIARDIQSRRERNVDGGAAETHQREMDDLHTKLLIAIGKQAQPAAFATGCDDEAFIYGAKARLTVGAGVCVIPVRADFQSGFKWMDDQLARAGVQFAKPEGGA